MDASNVRNFIHEVHVAIEELKGAVDSWSLATTIQFAIAMPDDLQFPEFGVEPDGTCMLDWHYSNFDALSASISGDGKVAYATMIDGKTGHGVTTTNELLQLVRNIEHVQYQTTIRDAIKRIAEHDHGVTVHYMAVGGSRSYGTHTEDSDYDIRGVFMAPLERYFGLDSIKSIMIPEYDGSLIYEAKHFFRLMAKSSPNVLELAFIDNRCVLACSEAFREVLDNRHEFLSKECVTPYLGFVRSCISKGDGAPPKKLGHAVRLLVQCREILEHGRLTVMLDKDTVRTVAAIRDGSMSVTDAIELARCMEDDIKRVEAKSQIREKIDRKAIDRMMVAFAKRCYKIP